MIECECYTEINKLPNIIGNLYENITEDSSNINNIIIYFSNHYFIVDNGSLYFFDDYLETEVIEPYRITRECLFKDIVSIEYRYKKEEE